MINLKSNGSSNPSSNNSSGQGSNNNSSSGETEEINTKDLAQRISAELKRYSIPQAIFAQRVLCRSQGTLSDLLRNPKPWSKLKSGRETFRRMQKWLSEPEFQRMSSLRLAVMQQSATEKERGRSACKRKDELPESRPPPPPQPQHKKPRLVFTDLQRRTLQAIFKETKRPSKEMQVTIARQLGLDPSTVSNFFMNARRRSIDKWREDPVEGEEEEEEDLDEEDQEEEEEDMIHENACNEDPENDVDEEEEEEEWIGGGEMKEMNGDSRNPSPESNSALEPGQIVQLPSITRLAAAAAAGQVVAAPVVHEMLHPDMHSISVHAPEALTGQTALDL